MKGSANIIVLRGLGTPPSTVEGSPPPLVIDHHRLSRELQVDVNKDKASKALLVLLIHGHGVEDLREAAHMISQGANVNYVLEEGEELPCHCSKCRDVVRPVSSAFIVRDRAPLEFWRLNTIADARIYATVVVRRALAALDNNYQAYLWQLVTKKVADFQSPLRFILALDMVPDEAAVRSLLEATEPKTGDTFLHVLARHSSEPAVTQQQWEENLPTWLHLFRKVLTYTLRSGLDHVLNARNKERCTPLHFAVLTNQDYMCSELVRAGARLDLRDVRGMTPLNWCYLAARHELAAQMLTLSKHCLASSHVYRPNVYSNGEMHFAAVVNSGRSNATVTTRIDPATKRKVTDVVLHDHDLPPRKAAWSAGSSQQQQAC